MKTPRIPPWGRSPLCLVRRNAPTKLFGWIPLSTLVVVYILMEGPINFSIFFFGVSFGLYWFVLVCVGIPWDGNPWEPKGSHGRGTLGAPIGSPFKANTNQFTPIQTNSNQFKPIQTNTKTNSNHFKPIQECNLTFHDNVYNRCSQINFYNYTKSAETLQVAPYGRCGPPGNP